MKKKCETIIELTVKNHPGVMSHIVSLFSRRAFNLDGILCWKTGISTKSRICLLVENNGRLEQITKQLSKLYDVTGMKVHRDRTKFLMFSKILEKIM